MRKSIEIFLSALALMLLLAVARANAQSRQSSLKTLTAYSSDSAGFKLEYDGQMSEISKNEYVIKLAGPTNSAGPTGTVRVFISQEPFVYLPGTYGGKYYFESNANDGIAKDRTAEDSIDVNGVEFAHDLWAVYAGMGQWETVDNCYSYHDGVYCSISLTRDFTTEMPGEIINSIRTTKRQIRDRLLDNMRDTTNVYVNSFNQIVRSFSIMK